MPDFRLNADGFGCITRRKPKTFIFSYYFRHYRSEKRATRFYELFKSFSRNLAHSLAIKIEF